MEGRTYKARIWADLDLSDITTYQDSENEEKGKKESYEGSVSITSHVDPSDTISGRGLACSCFAGKYRSITVRVKERDIESSSPCSYWDENQWGSLSREEFKEGYKPPPKPSPGSERSKFLFDGESLCKQLYQLIFAKKEQGVVVITGSTNTTKSTIVRGLIYMFLQRKIEESKRNQQRRPHLVTLEDPIEQFYHENKNGPAPPEWSQFRGLDYTPRDLEIDTKDIETALMRDALRQTPSVVYIGAIRNDQDWKSVVEFGGTGHLVVTTSHAGSLVESIDRILSASKKESEVEAKKRGQVIEKILAVVHLRADKIGDQRVILPALWRHTPTGVASFVNDGLGALLPHNPSVEMGQRIEDVSCLGRYWFATRLLNEGVPENIAKEVKDKAMFWDLEGI